MTNKLAGSKPASLVFAPQISSVEGQYIDGTAEHGQII